MNCHIVNLLSQNQVVCFLWSVLLFIHPDCFGVICPLLEILIVDTSAFDNVNNAYLMNVLYWDETMQQCVLPTNHINSNINDVFLCLAVMLASCVFI